MKTATCALLLLCHGWISQPAAGQRPDGEESRVLLDSEGWELVGDLRLPAAGEPYPGVLMLNQAAGDRGAYEELADRLAERGVASLRLDLRGHGESVNRGRFVPYAQKSLELIESADADVAAAHRYLSSHPKIDADRIAVVGASYSGEEMAEAGRKHGYAQAYVALSPGSYSEESIAAIDPSGIPWLFVKSVDERHLRGFENELLEQSRTFEIVIVPGKEHASNLLQGRPDLVERLAVWLERQLRE